MTFRSPLGLVLAGGGAHGAWQAGCLESLKRLGGETRVFQLIPSLRLTFSPFEFRTRFCRPAVEAGRESGRAFLADPSRHLVHK